MACITVRSLTMIIAVSLAASFQFAFANSLPSDTLNAAAQLKNVGFPEQSENSEFAKNAGLPLLHPALYSTFVTSGLLTGTEKVKPENNKKLGNWLNRNGLTSDAHELIHAIRNARNHGLNPQAYQLLEIDDATELLAKRISKSGTNRNAKGVSSTSDEMAHRFRLNTLFDTSFMKLVKHLGQGVVDGREVQKRLYRPPPQVDAFLLLLAVNNDKLSVNEALTYVMPSHPGYQRLTQTMSDLLSERAAGSARTTLPSSEQMLTNSSINHRRSLWSKLIKMGDPGPNADAVGSSDSDLLNAVKAFQARRGLDQDGTVGIKTLAALNASVADDIEAVAMSLERYRWLPRNLGERHIFINIPEFEVSLIDNEHTVLTMPAVMGKYQHQTPAFSRDMSYMEYNPTWTVPGSITRDKLLPLERRSPGYLARNNFEFLKNIDNQLVQVSASSVKRINFDAETFPYILRQRSGAGNALGRMKFMMPNKYAIYLHDTPAKSHFSHTERAYSHGCVRLSDPNALAQALMLGDGYAQSSIDGSMQSQHTHRIEFRRPVPTHIVYLTAWVDENHMLHKRPDIYENNEDLIDALRKANTLLSEVNTQPSNQADVPN